MAHGAAFAALTSFVPKSREVQSNAMELITVEVEAPKPPPPPRPEPTEVRKPRPRATPKAVAVAKPPEKEETPPPNEPAPVKPDKPVPLVVGISMSSTTTAGDFTAPTGNTLAGVSPKQAPSPGSEKLAEGPRFIPIYEVDTQPERVTDFVIPYPEDLRKNGIEGEVVMLLSIDAQGNVTKARVLKGPGHGLNEAAREAALKLKFKPATKRGQKVATDLTYTYRFELL
jgi:periplasmic protein TonB